MPTGHNTVKIELTPVDSEDSCETVERRHEERRE